MVFYHYSSRMTFYFSVTCRGKDKIVQKQGSSNHQIFLMFSWQSLQFLFRSKFPQRIRSISIFKLSLRRISLFSTISYKKFNEKNSPSKKTIDSCVSMKWCVPTTENMLIFSGYVGNFPNDLIHGIWYYYWNRPKQSFAINSMKSFNWVV